jgi:hypothetical protein
MPSEERFNVQETTLMSDSCPEGLDSNLLDWLEQEGYSLEMRVAQVFQQAGFHVSQFETYLDPESNDLREVDVVASVNRQVGDGIVVFVAFFIECKYHRSKPWVVFVSPKRLSPLFYFSRILRDNYDVHEWKAQSSLQGRLLARILSSLDRKRTSSLAPFSVPQTAGYGVREAFSGKDHAYEAIMQVSKCVDAHDTRVEMDFKRAVEGYEERLYEREYGTTGFYLSCSIAFPIIVGKGKLFECCLDSNNEMTLSEVNDSVVLIPGKSHTEEAVVAIPFTSVVRIVTEDHVHSFAEEAFRAASFLLSQESAIRELWEYEHRKILGKMEEIPF